MVETWKSVLHSLLFFVLAGQRVSLKSSRPCQCFLWSALLSRGAFCMGSRQQTHSNYVITFMDSWYTTMGDFPYDLSYSSNPKVDTNKSRATENELTKKKINIIFFKEKSFFWRWNARTSIEYCINTSSEEAALECHTHSNTVALGSYECYSLVAWRLSVVGEVAFEMGRILWDSVFFDWTVQDTSSCTTIEEVSSL